MTLTELKYIVAVARERHFGRAAEACFVSQPTLSVAIKKLEDELGVQLFERGSTEVSITPIGSQIVEQAQRVLEESSAIKEIARQGKDPLDGPLRLLVGRPVPATQVARTPRIGVDYAGAHAARPWRFVVRGHRAVSGRRLATPRATD